MSDAAVDPKETPLPRWMVGAALAVVLLTQTFFAFLQVGDLWVRGHNGWNGSAYHLSARNTLRWDMLFPVQYYTDNTPPATHLQYTHHPLAMHLHDSASVAIFGDHEWALRLVPGTHAVLAAFMLFVFVRRFWGDRHAILASLIYVCLPINAIYTNMANHSSGFIFWALLFFYAYLNFQERIERDEPGRWKWYGGAFFAFFMAASWDWPAYYIAFATALHWFATAIRRQRARPGSSWKPGVTFWSLVPYCVFVLVLFGGHFLLVDWVIGGTEELAGTFDERRDIAWARYERHLQKVPELMFTVPVLGILVAWIVAWFARVSRGKTEPRDLVPIAFAFAGLLHYFLFRWSAIVHSYWAWTGLVFVAIACATTLIALARSVGARLSPRLTAPVAKGIGVFLAVALMAPFAVRVVDIIPRGRRVGGSLWFEYTVRTDTPETYSSGRAAIRFAEKVRQWTDRETGVLVHRAFQRRRPEPRFDITMDRSFARTSGISERTPTREGITGWVLIAPVDAVPEAQRRRLASRHPYWQWGEFFMVDLRSDEPDVRVYRLVADEPSLAYWYFVSPFEPAVRGERSPERERELTAAN